MGLGAREIGGRPLRLAWLRCERGSVGVVGPQFSRVVGVTWACSPRGGCERRRALDAEPRTSLLDALREHLGLTGSKKGYDCGRSIVRGLALPTTQGLGRIQWVGGHADESRLPGCGFHAGAAIPRS